MKRILISLTMVFMLFANAEEVRTVTVTGTGTVFVAPSSAVINVGVSAEKQSVHDAMNTVDETIAAITEVLREFEIDPRSMQTAYVNLWQSEVWNETGPEYTFYANHTINVFVNDLSQLSPLISKLVDAGANSIGGVDFIATETDELTGEARERAMQSARAAAEQLAELSGGSIGQVLHVQEAASSTGMYMQPQYAVGNEFGIEAGQEAVRVTLEVVFALE